MAVLDVRHLSGEAWRAIVEPAGLVVVARAIRDADAAITAFEVVSRNDAARRLDLVVGGSAALPPDHDASARRAAPASAPELATFEQCRAIVASGVASVHEVPLVLAGDVPVCLDVTIVPFDDGCVAWAHDVTAQHASERDRRLVERQHFATIESLIDPHVVLDAVRDDEGAVADFVYREANAAACAYNHLSPDQLIGHRLLELWPEYVGTGLLDRYAELVSTGAPLVIDDHAFAVGNGARERRIDIRAVRIGDSISCTWRDVTERYHAEQRYRLLAEHVLDVVLEIDPDTVVRWASPSVERTLGWSVPQLVGTHLFDLLDPAELTGAVAGRNRMLQGEKMDAVERRFRTADGQLRWMWAQVETIRDDAGQVIAAVVGLRDCQAEVIARRAARTLSAGNAALAHATDEHDLLCTMCRIAVEEGGYALAWYARPVQDAEQSVVEVARSTGHDHYLDRTSISWGDGPLAQGPGGRTLRTGTTTVIADLASEDAFGPWIEAADDEGFRSTVCLPVHVDGALDGAFMVYAAEPDAFDGPTLDLLEDLAAQVGLGLGRLRGNERFMQSAADRKLLTSAIDQVGEAVVLTNPANRIIYANPAAVRATGYSLDELLGHPPPLLSSGRLEPGFYDAVRATLAAGESWHGTLLNQRKNGELFEEDATIGPVYDDQGELVAYVAVRRDLSVERRLEADLNRQHTDRDAVAALMRGIHPGPTLEGTARVLVHAVAALGGIDGAMVLIHQADGSIVPLAVAGVQVPGQELGVPLPIEQADGIIELVLADPWVLDLGSDDSAALVGAELAADIRASGITATAYAALRWDRRLTGILAVASTEADGATGLADRLGMLDELGSFAGALFGTQAAQYERIELQRDEVRAVIDGHRFHPVFQPVVELATRRVVGYEALTRFADGTAPDVQIARAHAVGLGPELEAACVRAAIEAAAGLAPAIWLSVNFSPRSVIDGHAAQVLAGEPGPFVIEVTEHDRIESYPALRRALAACGPWPVSVDDAGAGYASLRHILELEPDVVKLDLALVRDIDTDPARQALAAGLVHFAAQTGTTLIAEGVETAAEVDMLVELGVHRAQGYFFGRPAPFD